MYISTEFYTQEISMQYRMYKLENNLVAEYYNIGSSFLYFPKRDETYSTVLFNHINQELVVNPN
jgi:hypothetical protein